MDAVISWLQGFEQQKNVAGVIGLARVKADFGTCRDLVTRTLIEAERPGVLGVHLDAHHRITRRQGLRLSVT